ncbi:MAG TPA: hypothetical protein DCY51_02785, partial [Bacteroidetes bacterium]|nr:hypothetical protein [Bacteroidota bacterium]
ATGFTLLNTNGQSVLAQDLTNTKDFVIATEALSRGIYYLEVYTSAGRITTKLVK